jgi:hypothetical protein
MTAEELDDSHRMSMWFNLSQALELKLKEYHVLGLADPCSLAKAKVDIMEHKIVLSLDHLLRGAASTAEQSKISAACMVYVVTAFAEDPSSVLISLNDQPKLLNVRSRSIQQTNQVGTSPASSPFSVAGLRGTGQIVSFADTGLDESNCYFADPAGKVPRSPLKSPIYSPAFRKIIGYSGIDGRRTS